MKRWGRGVRGLLLMATIVWVSAAPAVAQEVSPFLPLDHWAVEAVRRLDALGLVGDGFDPVSRSLTVAEAERRLTQAEKAADPSLGPVVRGWRDLGAYTGARREIALDMGDARAAGRSGCALLVQREATGEILGAAMLRFGGS